MLSPSPAMKISRTMISAVTFCGASALETSTVAAVVRTWGEAVDYAICYQSRATPQKWIEPSTETEIERAAKDSKAVLVVPIAFVSEHTETLVELDV